MISRCYSKGSGGYKRYGARGITVCDRWRSDFFTFVHDMGPKPSPRHTVDRINNDLGYGPGNCRWATRVEQGRNRTDNIPIGRYKTIIAASEATGIPACTLGWRKINGWPDDLSLSTAATRSNAHMRQQTKEKAT